MSKPIVYLAGPVSGLSYGNATTWRFQVENAIGDSFTIASPLRDKEYLVEEQCLDHTNNSYGNVLSSPQGVMTRDSWDVHRADLVFVNLISSTTISIGTVMEMAWAWKAGIPIIVAMEPDNIHRHVMLQMTTPFYADTLDDAISLVWSLFNN